MKHSQIKAMKAKLPTKTTGLNKVTYSQDSTHYNILINGNPFTHIPLNYHGDGKVVLVSDLHKRIEQAKHNDQLGKKMS